MYNRAKEFLALMKKARVAFEKIAGHGAGHVRFSYKDKKDKLVLVCNSGEIKQIVAKDGACDDGECISWEDSEFAGQVPLEAFYKYFDQIDRIEVSHPHVDKTWNSIEEFERWLNYVINKQP
ncbi:MAG: hypothetical protein ISS92_01940 [Candidatus Omnitrophica bacterium]|nr:hypothetical protein [Candidatus Omnitrophota bacterium]